ncbi:MAG: signal peptidase II [Candidatus Sericytochromatia bacterium]
MSESNKKNIAIAITYVTTLVMFGLDQWTKQMIINAMPISVDVINKTATSYKSYEFLSWLWFTHVVNFGAAFSSFYGKKYLLLAFASIISIGIIIYERQSARIRPKILSFSLGFLLAGALGNLFDRARMGYVTDFLDFRNNGHNVWPIFNVADVSINIGIALLVIYFLFIEGKMSKIDDNLEDDDIPERI